MVYTVLADTEREVAAALDRLCAALGLAPLSRPQRVVGRARWMARAQTPTREPHGAGQE